MSQSTICRLCVKGCSDFKSLYSDNGRQNVLYQMTVEYFHPMIVDMKRATHLSNICLECFRCIYDFRSFQMRVMSAQSNLTQDHVPLTIKFEEEEGEGVSEVIVPELNPLSENERPPDAEIYEIAFVGDRDDVIVKPELEIIDVYDQNSPGGAVQRAGAKKRVLNAGPSKKETGDHPHTVTKDAFKSNTEGLSDGNSQAGNPHLETKTTRPNLQSIKTEVSSESESWDISQANDNGPSKRFMFSCGYDPTTKRFKCKLCGYSFMRRTPFECHMRKRHWKQNYPLTKRSDKLRKTEDNPDNDSEDPVAPTTSASVVCKSNTDDSPEMVKCKLCGVTYRSVGGLRYHLRKEHPGIRLSMFSSDYNATTKSFKCKLCGISFLRKANFVLHMRRQHRPREASTVADTSNHSSKKSFTCDVCVISYASQYRLKKHMKQEHGTQYVSTKIHFDFDYDETTKRFSCKICGSCYELRYHLNKHMEKTHPEKRKIKVNSDNVSFESSLADETYQCQFCDQYYMLESQFKNHMRRRHGQEDETSHKFEYDYDATAKMFKCKLCDKSYGRKMTLKTHWQRQHWEKSNISQKNEFDYDDTTQMFKCKMCDSSYIYKRTLIRHLARQHGTTLSETNYKCQKCSKLFLTKHGLVRHCRRVHCPATLKDEVA